MTKKKIDPFHDFVTELFAPLGAVTIRRMFGGAGVYLEGVMFALLADEQVYLKTDPDLRRALEAEGGAAFVWTRPTDGRLFDMGYVSLPSEALDEPELASRWASKALAIARSAKLKKTRSLPKQ
jgi:DNA transformation protein